MALGTHCRRCGSVFPEPANRKWCAPCRIEIDRARTREWWAKNPEARKKNQARAPVINSIRRKRGIERSEKMSKSIFTCRDTAAPDLAWHARTWLPFSYSVSKNSLYRRDSRRPKSAIFMRAEARRYRDAIVTLIQQLTKPFLAKNKLKQAKLWIDIFVEKPDHRGDAINVIDLVCDAIKMAIPLDDRWYCIRSLDWAVNKKDPRLYIGLGQEIGATDSKVCSYCGVIEPLEKFSVSRASAPIGGLGHGNICVECRRLRPGEYKKRRPYRRPLS